MSFPFATEFTLKKNGQKIRICAAGCAALLMLSFAREACAEPGLAGVEGDMRSVNQILKKARRKEKAARPFNPGAFVPQRQSVDQSTLRAIGGANGMRAIDSERAGGAVRSLRTDGILGDGEPTKDSILGGQLEGFVLDDASEDVTAIRDGTNEDENEEALLTADPSELDGILAISKPEQHDLPDDYDTKIRIGRLNRYSPLDAGKFGLSGANALRLPGAKVKSTLIVDVAASYGLNETKAVSGSLGLRIKDFTISATFDRGQWLDVRTNTGKLTNTYSVDLCTSLAFELDPVTFIPCGRFGTGRGDFKARDAYGNLVAGSMNRISYRGYMRYVAVATPYEGFKIALEGTGGYNKDVFLDGAFFQIWIRTPAGISVGVEIFELQRTSIMFTASSGFF